jgi:hypothetical protein
MYIRHDKLASSWQGDVSGALVMAGNGDTPRTNAEGRGGSTSDGSHAANPTDVLVPSLKRHVFVVEPFRTFRVKKNWICARSPLDGRTTGRFDSRTAGLLDARTDDTLVTKFMYRPIVGIRSTLPTQWAPEEISTEIPASNFRPKLARNTGKEGCR